MKKTSIILATMLAATPVMADEGMWTLYDLPKAAFEQMQSEGFTMP